MSALVLVAAPATEPVTLAEVKAHLRIDHTDDDALLTGLMEAARLHLEGKDGILNRAFVTQTWDYMVDAFPCGVLQLPLSPLQSVTSIKYIDTNGAEQTLDSSKYIVDAKSAPARIIPAYNEFWPATRWQVNAVTVRFVAGYGPAASDVPRPIRTGLLGLIADMYEHRESSVAMPQWLKALLGPYRVWM